MPPYVLGRCLESNWVPRHELARIDPGPMPPGSRDSRRISPRIEAKAGDDHEDVFCVRVDGDPMSRAGLAPTRELRGDHRHVEQSSAMKGVAHRPRAVVAAAEPAAVPSAPDIGSVPDLVRCPNYLFHRCGSSGWRERTAMREASAAVGGRPRSAVGNRNTACPPRHIVGDGLRCRHDHCQGKEKGGQSAALPESWSSQGNAPWDDARLRCRCRSGRCRRRPWSRRRRSHARWPAVCRQGIARRGPFSCCRL
jgi:hypothetical protein